MDIDINEKMAAQKVEKNDSEYNKSDDSKKIFWAMFVSCRANMLFGEKFDKLSKSV